MKLTPILSALIVGFAGIGAANAQNSLTVPFEVESVSNPSLAPESPGSVNLIRISPRYAIESVEGERRSVLTLGAVIERSSDTSLSDDRNLPSVDYRLEFGSPTSAWVLQGMLEEVSTRSTEFTDFGRVGIDSTQRTASLGAQWTGEMTPTSSLALGGGYLRVRYDTPLLIGYEELNVSALYRMQVGERSRMYIDGRLARLDPVDDTRSSSRAGALAGYEVDLSDQVTFNASLGVVRTSGLNRETDPVGGLGIAYEGDRLTSSLELVREVSASGTVGGYDRVDALRGRLSYPVTPQTTLSLDLGHTRTLGLLRDQGTTVGVRVASELTEFWSLTFGVEQRRSKPQGMPSGSGHVIGLGLVYSHPNF
ncbi:MAG: hypothetical protein R3E94_13435 [Burkholderiaceae bacterium]